jgi:DNA-directed RNA polymerase subunit M
MLPKGDFFICNTCGAKKKKSGSSVVIEKQKQKETIVLEKKIDILPKTRIECPKCGNKEAFWILRQDRKSVV